MNTDWQAVLVLGLVLGIPATVCPLIYRSACRDMKLLRRRLVDPQRGAAPGTGVECEPPASMAAPSDVDALPRSPFSKPAPSSAKAWSNQTPVGVVDPRPTAPAGPHAPVAAAAIHAAATGLQTPAGACNLRPNVPAGPQSPGGAAGSPSPAPSGFHRRQVVIHAR